MSMDINAFTNRLTQIGVIDEKTRKAVVTYTSQAYKDPRFPDMVNNMLEEIEKWHNTASEIRYASDTRLAKSVSEGIKLVLKFAKSNVSSANIKMSVADDFNRKLSNIGVTINNIAQMESLNLEGNTVNLRNISLEMLGVYKDAVKQQSTTVPESDVYSTEFIKASAEKIDGLTALVSSVVDASSKEGAENQTKMFTYINSWEKSFSYGNFEKSSLNELDKALVCAKAWALSPLNLKAKVAKEGEYVTADIIGTRTRALATTFDAVTKINQAISLIGRAKVMHAQITNTERLEAQKAENDKELENIKKRIEEIKYLANTRQIDLKEAFDEKKFLEQSAMPPMQKTSERLNSQILGMKRRKSNLKMTIMQIENVCHNFLTYKDEPRIINLFAEYVNFEALTNFLGGSKLDSNINDIVNLAAIEKITLQKFDEANDTLTTAMDQQLDELEPISIDEEQTEKLEMSEEELLRAIMGDSATQEPAKNDFDFDFSDLGETKIKSLSDEDN